jgi:hypothetical protein
MPRSIVLLPVALALMGCCALAHAARPFVTDDARIVDPGGYQIESFIKHQRNVRENEFWFLPAWNPGSIVELTLGGFAIRNAEAESANAVIAQAKALLRPLRTNDFGLAVTVGALRQEPLGPADGAWSPFVNLISSLSVLDEAVVVHANVGLLDDRQSDVKRYTWGLGAEIATTARLWVIAETYNQEGDKPSTQVGLRYWAIPNRMQVDGTFGAQHSEPQNRSWISIGVRILF